jgi:hypothetical protein
MANRAKSVIVSDLLIVLALCDVVAGSIGCAFLITDERTTCDGSARLYSLIGELYTQTCTTGSPYVLLGIAVIVGAVSSGFLLLQTGLRLRHRDTVQRAVQASENGGC